MKERLAEATEVPDRQAEDSFYTPLALGIGLMLMLLTFYIVRKKRRKPPNTSPPRS
jgi:LPXTG-motif cell wall-anchored protein